MFNGNCVTVNSDGVCEGTNGMIANNNKQMCDGENYFRYFYRHGDEPGRGLINFSIQLVGPNARRAKFQTLVLPLLLIKPSVLAAWPG